MLKRKAFKKICLIIACLLVVEIILLFPKEKEVSTLPHTVETGILYLLDDNNYVARVDYLYNAQKTEDLIREMVDALTINHAKSLKIRSGFKAVIPEKTKLLSLSIDGTCATLNFSKEFLDVDELTEEKMIEALIYSITTIEEIDSIVIKVEENPLEYLPHSKKKLPPILDRSFKINKEYNLKSMQNITETTIYYLAKKDDYLYYIPVTKYQNSNKEKIEIIIDELKSSTTYNTNLISYLKEETELINYELLDKSLLLNFNDQILNDINANNIIEEVTYAIDLSVSENYQVDTVFYSVDDKLLNHSFLFLG